MINSSGILATLKKLLIFVGLVAACGCAQSQTLALAEHVEKLDVRAREPMAAEHPDGALFVTGYGAFRPNLWKSTDHGKTWGRVNVGTEAEGAAGNSDCDLAIAPDGTIYFLNMTFDRQKNEGLRVDIAVSKDAGASWRWTQLSNHRYDDRPWVQVSPDGTAHVIWNDGSGVNYSVSRDGGVTWTRRPRINDQGGSSHLAVGPKREVAVRVTPKSASGLKFHEGVDLIVVSTDGGATWNKYPAPGHRKWSVDFGEPKRWVEPLAWDARGALYSFWADGKELWLARSLDQGKSWKTWKLATGSENAYYPYLTARGQGELAATWFSGESEKFQAHVARMDAAGVEPKMFEAAPFVPDSWTTQSPTGQNGPAVPDPAGEYLAVIFLKAGGLAVVSPIQNTGKKREGFSWWRFENR
jgi:photosystem II stability/assembly factor-like uncharacterized protein